MTGNRIRCATAASVAWILLLVGCSDLMHNPRADEAQQRWGHMRARVKLQLAERNFESGAVEDALKQCNEVIRLDPEFVEGYLLAARIYLEKGENSKARATLDAALIRTPMSAETSYLQGLIAEGQGRSDEALNHYRDAYQAAPDELDYLLTYVESLIAADQCDEALAVITPRRRDFSQTPAVHTLRGQVLCLVGRLTEAAECYQLAVQLAPDNPLLREEAGITALAAGCYEEAIETLMPLARRQTGQLPKGQLPKPSVNTLRALGAAIVRAGKTRAAAQTLEQAVREYAQDPALWLMLAEAHLRSGDLMCAAAAADQAGELEPDGVEPQLVLAYVALQTDQPQDAIDAARRVLDRHPDDVEARALLARALECTPDGTAKAAEQYRRILALVPNDAWTQHQLQAITQQPRTE